jgi:hypothetical protein
MNPETIRLLASAAAILGVAAGILVAWLHLSRTEVDPWRDGVSAYALTRVGNLYRIQAVGTGVAALLVSIALLSAGLSTGVAVSLLVAFGVSRVLIARYPTDPRGTTRFSRTGRLHILLATVTFLSIAVAAPALAGTLTASDGWTGSADLLTVLGWATTACVLGTFASNTVPATRRVFGLVERGAYAGMLAWLVVAAAGINGLA